MNYKVGDKVLVRSDLIVGRAYGLMGFTNDMVEFCGNVVTIESVGGISYKVKEYRNPYFTNEMFVGLAEEKPMEFKVGDRVKAVKASWGSLKVDDIGTIIHVETDNYGVEFDKANNGHDCCGKGKHGHCWWMDAYELELVKDESKPTPVPEPTPTPVNVNITVNLYENSCWYCREGGLVDLYLAGTMGICPSCGRVCNNHVGFKLEHKGSKVIEFKSRKNNEPLTTEQLEALSNGTKVFTLWLRDGKEDWSSKKTAWRKKSGSKLCRDNGNYTDITWNGKTYRAYLEEPERPF